MLPPQILITGAGGFVGAALLRALERWPGAGVLATGRRPARDTVWHRGGYAELDVLDADAVERAFEDFAPSLVVHLAAESRVEACETDRAGCWALNVDTVETLASACHRHGARLILMSSDMVFSGAGGPYAEDARPGPINAYGRTKLAAENTLRTSRLQHWAIARTTLVYGRPAPGARGNLVSWLVRELSAGRPVRVVADQRRTPTLDADLADGLVRLIRYGKNGIYHLAGREWLSPFDTALRVADAFGLDRTLVSPATTAAVHPDAPRPILGGLLTLRAESELGFRATPLDDALRALHAGWHAPSPSDRRRRA